MQPANRKLILLVFVVALAARLVYLADYRDAPFFERPFGDSAQYHERALEIAAGDVVGRQAAFLGSPLYPYFLALVYKLVGVDFTLVYLIQLVLGSATCVLIFLLAQRVAPGRPVWALVAGLMAAVCGTFVYYGALLLGTTLELFFVTASLLSLVSARRDRSFFVAGLLLGLAVTLRPNLLLFVVVAMAWIVTGFRMRLEFGRWRPAATFALGCVIAVTPITIRNYVAAHDFVLVSSSAGVNLFIGNNPDATGYLTVPPESGLEFTRLFESSRDVAEAATGAVDMEPSAVSRYWASRARDFIEGHPDRAAGLLLERVRLFWNHYEVPNVYNKYFVAASYAPSMRWLFVGFGLIAPLALVGILLQFRKERMGQETGLLLGFVLAYMLSVVPFFITSRYRIAVAPILIVFAATGLSYIQEVARNRRFRWLAAALVLGAAAAVGVNRGSTAISYWHSRAAAGMAHVETALAGTDDTRGQLERGIVELKKALELSPEAIAPHYHLGLAYRRAGFEDEAVAQFEAVLARQPSNRFAREALETRPPGEPGGSTVLQSIPLTPFEAALEALRAGDLDAAEHHLRRAIHEDPQHAHAHNELGALLAKRGDHEAAIRQYKTGLRFEPNSVTLLANLGVAYAQAGRLEDARSCFERCLEIRPEDENIRRALRALDARMRAGGG